MVGAEPLLGGMSSAVFRCRLQEGAPVVVRHITDRGWIEREPHLIRNEASALMLLASSRLRTPRLVATDADDLLIMSNVPGRVVVESRDLRSLVDEMASIAAEIAAVDLTVGHQLAAWRPWVPLELAPPPGGDRRLWLDAFDAWETGRLPPIDEPVLLHRDFHPLNLLQDDDGTLAVVDWVNACVGHPHAELGHCRWNLSVLVGQRAADAFLASYLSLRSTPTPYDRSWDLATVLGLLPGPFGTSAWHSVGRSDLTDATVISATEQFLADTLRHL